jgi:hypothetical protein
MDQALGGLEIGLVARYRNFCEDQEGPGLAMGNPTNTQFHWPSHHKTEDKGSIRYRSFYLLSRVAL